MNPATSIRSLWSGLQVILAGSRKKTVVICPTAQRPAQVEVDPAHGLQSCSRWPELQAACTEACMPQVRFSAEELKDFTTRYRGKRCASCGAQLTRDDWYSNRLAALDLEMATKQVPGSSPLSPTPMCSTCYGARDIN